jgi:hypothetical protein
LDLSEDADYLGEILEVIGIMQDKKFMRATEAGLKDIEEGGGIPLDELIEGLNLKYNGVCRNQMLMREYSHFE